MVLLRSTAQSAIICRQKKKADSTRRWRRHERLPSFILREPISFFAYILGWVESHIWPSIYFENFCGTKIMNNSKQNLSRETCQE